MNRRIAAKVFIDAAMLVLYVQLTFFYGHNTTYHEVMGILIGVLFAVHIALNIAETKSLIKRRRVAPLIMDAILLAVMVVNIVSGLLVARDLFLAPGYPLAVTVHTIAAYVGIGVIALHLAQHAKCIAAIFKARRKSPVASKDAGAMGSEALSRRTFAKSAVIAAAGVFAAASFVVLEVPALKRLSQAEEEPVATYTIKRSSVADEVFDEPSQLVETSSSQSSDDTGSSGASSESDSEIHCSLCQRNCPLSGLQCKRGVAWAEENGYL